MPETKTMTFSHKEVVEALIKQNDIHEGLWGIYVEFGLAATNMSGPDKMDVLPTAIIPVKQIGLQRFDEPSNITVDASKCNPLKKKLKK